MTRGRIAICGTGRAGTTLLVKLLHRAGLETGYDDTDLCETDRHVAQAGLERVPSPRTIERFPDVFKSPQLHKVGERGLREGWLALDLLIVPMRDVDEVVRSRRSVTLRQITGYIRGAPLRGGMVGGARNVFRQREVLLDGFYRTIEMAAKHRIELILLEFPRLARDPDHFAGRLAEPLARLRGVSPDALIAAHRAECRPELIRHSAAS